MKGRLVGVLAAGLAVGVATACSPPAEERAGKPATAARALSVYTVNYPLRYFAERIGAGTSEVAFPAPPGVDPAFWSPDGAIVAAYQDADRILLNGAGYAGWTQLALLPRSRTVDTSAAFRDRLIPLTDTVTHQHGPKGAHTHSGSAFTTWLDPTLAVLQSRAIAASLAEARPDHATEIRANLAGLERDLNALDARLEAAAAKIGDAPLLFSHPVYDYLIRRYTLNARSLHWEPDTEPDPRSWHELRELLATHPARWMLWESAPLPGVVRALEDLGIASAVFDPTGNVPAEGDYLAVMARNAAALERIAASRTGTARTLR